MSAVRWSEIQMNRNQQQNIKQVAHTTTVYQYRPSILFIHYFLEKNRLRNDMKERLIWIYLFILSIQVNPGYFSIHFSIAVQC